MNKIYRLRQYGVRGAQVNLPKRYLDDIGADFGDGLYEAKDSDGSLLITPEPVDAMERDDLNWVEKYGVYKVRMHDARELSQSILTVSNLYLSEQKISVGDRFEVQIDGPVLRLVLQTGGQHE
jgi:hypothetical protein